MRGGKGHKLLKGSAKGHPMRIKSDAEAAWIPLQTLQAFAIMGR